MQYEDEEAEAEPEPPRSQLYTSAPKTVAPPAPARIQVTGAHRTPETVYTAAQKPTRIDYGYTQSTVELCLQVLYYSAISFIFELPNFYVFSVIW